MAKAEDQNADLSWQQRAVDRSLTNARARAVSRSAQILAAARELLDETGGIDFTVQEIVDRSGLSLRSFYKHFAGKDELLLALFEEVLRSFANRLRKDIAPFDDPVDRLQAYVSSYYARAELTMDHGGRALGTYNVRMLEVHRHEFGVALAPQIALLSEIIEDGVATGQFRGDIDTATIAGLLTITLMSVSQMSVLGVDLTGTSLSLDQLWAWCAVAVGATEVASVKPKTAKKAAVTKRAASTKKAASAATSRPSKPR